MKRKRNNQPDNRMPSPLCITLATHAARMLGATPATDPPARALFNGGEIVMGVDEVAVWFHDLGCLFVTAHPMDDNSVDFVVEAVAFNDGDVARPEMERRHAALQSRSDAIFGEAILYHDPMGLRAGATPTVKS